MTLANAAHVANHAAAEVVRATRAQAANDDAAASTRVRLAWSAFRVAIGVVMDAKDRGAGECGCDQCTAGTFEENPEPC